MSLPRSHSDVIFDAIGKSTLITWYVFDHAGDEIALHSHDDFSHSSSVVSGRFEFYDGEGHSIERGPTETVEFPKGRRHAIRALIDGSVLLSINEPGTTAK